MSSSKYRTTEARNIRSLLPTSRRERSYVISLALFGLSAVAYLFTFAFAYWPDLPLLNIAGAIFNGLVIGLLFIIGHDACHGSFTPSAALNRFIARTSFLTSLQPYASWVYTHNGLHHGWTNLKGKDIVFAPYSFAEYQALSWHRRLLERFYRSPWGLGFMHLTQVWWKHELFPSPQDLKNIKSTFQFDRLLVSGFLVIKFGAGMFLSYAATGELVYSALWAVAMLAVTYTVWFWLIGFVTFQQHTHPEVPWYDDPEEWDFYRGQINSTPHISFPKWIHKLLYNVMDHNAHHVDPLIPLYQLPESQRRLESHYSEDLVMTMWTFRGYLQTLRVCRLYDYAKHQWLDYDGRPTSRSGLNLLAGDSNIKLAA